MATVLVCGAINWDTTCLVEHLPFPGEEVTCNSVSEVPGGTGANVAVAAARILGPGEVALFAALGRDGISDMQLTILDAEGVEHGPIARIQGQSSGHAYIFVDHTGQNVIASNLGANSALSTRHIRIGKVHTLLQECHCIALTDPPLPVASDLLRAAASRDLPVLWDPGTLARHGWDVLVPLASQVDSLFVNEAEANWLFGTADPRDIVRSLDHRGAPSHLVLKMGARGSLLIDVGSGGTTEIPPLPIDALGLQVVSAVGCGDVFLGAFAAYRSRGRERGEALLMASAAAGLNATRPETRGGPTEALLNNTIDRALPLGFPSRGAEGNVK